MNHNLEFDDGETQSSSSQLIEYTMIEGVKVYSQRWLVLASFGLFAFTNAIPFVEYSGILPSATSYYNRTESDIVWFSNIYYLDYIFFGILFIVPIQKYLASTIITSSLIIMIGNAFIYFYSRNYFIAIGAYVLFGIAQIVQMTAPVFIANRWFPAQERTLATTLGTLVVYMGLNYAFMFPSVYLNNTEPGQASYDKIETVNLISLVLSASAFLLCCIFARSQPPTPPSASATDDRADIKSSFKSFIRDKETFMDTLTLSVCIQISIKLVAGISWSFISIIGVILEPFGYSQIQIGLVGLCFQLTGTISGVIAAIIIDKQIARGQIPSYDLCLKCLLSVSFVGIVLLSLTIQLENLPLSCILSAMVGFGLNAYFSIALQSFVEKLYPCSELAIATGMYTVAETFGLASNFVVTIQSLQKYGLFLLTGIQIPFIIYLVFFYKTELNRTKKEKLQQLNQH